MSVKSILVLVLILLTSAIDGQEVDNKGKTIKLDKRVQPKYLNSGYSFRYRTNDIRKHKNNVDLVYEAGRMRINNHAGIEQRVADLGELESFDSAKEIKISDAKWSKENIQPVVGKTYAFEIKENRHRLIALIRVKKVSESHLEFVWQPVGTGKWPVDISYRAQNGTSGMMRPQRSERGYPR